MEKHILEYIFPVELTEYERAQYFKFISLYDPKLPRECLMHFQCNKELLIPISGYNAFKKWQEEQGNTGMPEITE